MLLGGWAPHASDARCLSASRNSCVPSFLSRRATKAAARALRPRPGKDGRHHGAIVHSAARISSNERAINSARAWKLSIGLSINSNPSSGTDASTQQPRQAKSR
jgi:hypothetical protein